MSSTNRGFGLGIIIVIIAVVALGGGALYVSHQAPVEVKEENAATASSSEKTAVSAPSTTSLTLTTALLSRGDYRCTFDINNSNSVSKGTYFIHDQKIRGDFETSVPGFNQVIKSHTIIDGTTSYSWSDMAPMGVKIKVQNSEAGIKSAEESLKLNGSTLDYTCEPESANESLFTVPTSITFMETAGIR